MEAANVKTLRRRLDALIEGAETITGTGVKIAQAARQAQETGGALSVQPQIAFLVGALMRLQKDWGVIEHLQTQGVTAPWRKVI